MYFFCATCIRMTLILTHSKFHQFASFYFWIWKFQVGKWLGMQNGVEFWKQTSETLGDIFWKEAAQKTEWSTTYELTTKPVDKILCADKSIHCPPDTRKFQIRDSLMQGGTGNLKTTWGRFFFIKSQTCPPPQWALKIAMTLLFQEKNSIFVLFSIVIL